MMQKSICIIIFIQVDTLRATVDTLTDEISAYKRELSKYQTKQVLTTTENRLSDGKNQFMNFDPILANAHQSLMQVRSLPNQYPIIY